MRRQLLVSMIIYLISKMKGEIKAVKVIFLTSHSDIASMIEHQEGYSTGDNHVRPYIKLPFLDQQRALNIALYYQSHQRFCPARLLSLFPIRQHLLYLFLRSDEEYSFTLI